MNFIKPKLLKFPFRYRKELEKEFNPLAAKDEHGNYLHLSKYKEGIGF